MDILTTVYCGNDCLWSGHLEVPPHVGDWWERVPGAKDQYIVLGLLWTYERILDIEERQSLRIDVGVLNPVTISRLHEREAIYRALQYPAVDNTQGGRG